MPKSSINFVKILLRARGNFEERNEVLESPTITINYCIIVNAYYNYVV